VTEEFTQTVVRDTNGIMDDEKAIFRFAESDVFIPSRIIAELDHNKNDKTDGKTCRNVISLFAAIVEGKTRAEIEAGFPLDSIFLTVSNMEGRKVEIPPTGRLFFQTYVPERTSFLFPEDESDNKILSVALDLRERGKKVVLISNDANFRIKATLEGIVAKPYEGESHGPKKRPWKKGYQDNRSRRFSPHWKGKKVNK